MKDPGPCISDGYCGRCGEHMHAVDEPRCHCTPEEQAQFMSDLMAGDIMDALLTAPPQAWSDEAIGPLKRAFDQVCAENPERVAELQKQWAEMSDEERAAFEQITLGHLFPRRKVGDS